MRARDRRTRKGPERVAKGRSGRPATKRGRRSDPDFRTRDNEATRNARATWVEGAIKSRFVGFWEVKRYWVGQPVARDMGPGLAVHRTLSKGGAGNGDKDDQGYSRSEIEGDSIEFFHLT